MVRRHDLVERTAHPARLVRRRLRAEHSAGIRALADGQFQLVVDDRPATLYFTAGRLRQEPGAAPGAELTVRTSSACLDRGAAGEAGWDDGRASGEVIIEGPPAAWPRWLAATGYLLQVKPGTT